LTIAEIVKISLKRSRKMLRQGETLRPTGNHGVNVNRPLGGLQFPLAPVGACPAGEINYAQRSR